MTHDETIDHGASLVSQPELYQDLERCPGYVMSRKAFFFVPSHKVDLRLTCAVRAPAGPDRRSLGVLISGVTVEDDFGAREIPLHRLPGDKGFHEVERDGTSEWRWTEGTAELATNLLQGVRGPFILRLDGIFEFES